MKHDRLFTFLEATILGFLLSFSALACFATAFPVIPAKLGLLALCSLGGAAVCSYFVCRKKGLILLGLVALSAGILWQNGTLADGFEALLWQISSVYHDAYGWRILSWSHRSTEEMLECLAPFIYTLGAFLGLLTAWTICRGQSSIVACVPAALPVLVCFVTPDSMPGTLWLLVYMTVMAVMTITSTTRQTNRAQGRQLTLYTALPLFLTISVLFLAIPRETYNRQTQAQAIGDFLRGKHSFQQMLDRLTGEPIMVGEKKVDLSAIGPRKETAAQILEVTSRQTSGLLYLRTTALDQYAGTQWFDSESPLPALNWPDKPQAAQTNEVHIKTQYAHEMLYLPYYAIGVDTRNMTRGIVNTQKLNEYSVTQLLLSPGSVSYGMGSLTEEQQAQANLLTELPSSTRKWAEPLAKQIVGDITDPYKQALEIAKYVKGSAQYNKNTKKMPADSGDFAQWFLEESSTGYCVHYATAGAVLLKALNIPARYVSGYMVQAQAGAATPVRASDAHAWVEYWLPGYGWTLLECTPTLLTDTPEETTTAPAEDPHIGESGEKVPDFSAEESLPGWLWLTPVPGGLLVLWLQRRLRLYARNKRCSRGNANSRALAKWVQAERLSRFLGQTPPEALQALAEKAKFSPYLLTEAELQSFDKFLHHATTRLQKKPFLRRLWEKWILVLY